MKKFKIVVVLNRTDEEAARNLQQKFVELLSEEIGDDFMVWAYPADRERKSDDTTEDREVRP